MQAVGGAFSNSAVDPPSKTGEECSQKIPVRRSCRDKNVIVPCSERGQIDQNASERTSGEGLTNQIE